MEKLKIVAMNNTWLNGRNHGWGNGYVILPKGHKYHEVDCENIPVDVHYGLTFSDSVEKLLKHSEWASVLPKDLNGDEWVIGFDTCHSGDTMLRWPDEKSVLLEAQRLADQL